MIISTFEAKCSECKAVFAHPSFGDFSYGSFIYTTKDGNNFIYCDALSDTVKMVSNYFPQKIKPEVFQYLLVSLADQPFNSSLTNKITCPKCHSTNIDYWHGNKLSSIDVNAASFEIFSSLDDSSKHTKIKSLLNAIA